MPSDAFTKASGKRQTVSIRLSIAPVRICRCWCERSCLPMCCPHLPAPDDAKASKVHHGQNVGIGSLTFAAASIDLVRNLIDSAPHLIECLQVSCLG